MFTGYSQIHAGMLVVLSHFMYVPGIAYWYAIRHKPFLSTSKYYFSTDTY